MSRPTGIHLTASHQSILNALLERYPKASNAQVAKIFAAKTGIVINRCSVDKRRRMGAYKKRPSNGHLSPTDRQTLVELIRDNAPESSYPEISRQFALLTGRAITVAAVWRIAVNELGLPRRGKGNHARYREQPFGTIQKQQIRESRIQALQDIPR